jgi:CRISP-associated protein Cas1
MPRFASRPRTGRDWNVCYVIVPGPSLPAITAKAPGSPGYGRNRRPPRDPINALLSLGYALALKLCRPNGGIAWVGPGERPGNLSGKRCMAISVSF